MNGVFPAGLNNEGNIYHAEKSWNIVIADDEQMILKWLKKNISELSEAYCIGAVCVNGRQALEYCLEHQADILFSDIRMPVMDGLELLEHLAGEDGPGLPFTVILSAYDDFVYVREAFKLGANEYLLKPEITKESLKKCLDAACRWLEKREEKKIQEQKPVPESADLLHTGPDQPAAYSEVVRNILKYIEESYAEDIRLDELAALVHLNKSYLSTRFKKETGINIYDYLLKYRIEKAKQLLLETDRQIQDICCSVGMPDSAYFSRQFRRFTGESPLKYRKVHKHFI